MDGISEIFQELRELRQHYGLSTERLDTLETELTSAKVCIPLIGKFSSGKSALLNTLLGTSRKLLSENIAPETAVPTELEYTTEEPEKQVTIYYQNRDPESCTLEDYYDKTLDAECVERVHIKLCSSALARFPDVELVDMPGFESGIEVHNRAIDSYVGNSMAYLIAFPADDMTLRKSIGNILKELLLHEMRLAIVITKCDKKDGDEVYEETLASLKQSLTKYIGEREIPCYETSSRDGRVESVIEFLEDIQSHAQELRLNRCKARLRAELDEAERQIRIRLEGGSLTESELTAQEERLRGEMEEQQRELETCSKAFSKRLPACVSAISGDIQSALSKSEDGLITMVLNNQDISEPINLTVRGALTRGIQEHYLPLERQYIQDANSAGINTEIDTVVSMTGFSLQKNSIVGPIVAGAVAALFNVLGGILLGIFLKHRQEKKRNEMKEQIRAKLNGEVFPQVVSQVEKRLQEELDKRAKEVQTNILNQGANQKAELEQALQELYGRMEAEQEEKKQAAEADQANLNRLEEMRNEF